MPTLRNKTTGSGRIIRWKPHPDHHRPSTYQVSSRAVSHLREQGYDVPNPGDEVPVPHQLCRPLRLLDDLYFESQGQSDIEKDAGLGIDFYRKSPLSAAQVERLRDYIQAHPSYIGGVRSNLADEFPGLDGVDEEPNGPLPMLDRQNSNIRMGEDGEMLLPGPFHLGQIDRISNNDNAMLQTTTGKEINLGRLPESSVGEWAVAVRYRGDWSICLNAQLWSQGYRSDARSYIDTLSDLTGIDGLSETLHIESRSYDRDLLNQQLEVTISFASHTIGVGYHGEKIVLVDSELVSGGQRIAVEVDSEYGNVAIARPCLPTSEDALEPGDTTTVSVATVGQNVLAGAVDNQLVVIERESDIIPDRVRIQITEKADRFVTGSVAALAESDRPAVGEPLSLRNGQAMAYPDIPVSIPETPLSEDVPIKLPVTAVKPDSIQVSAKEFAGTGTFPEGKDISSSTHHQTADGLVLQVEDVPILVEDGRHIPGVETTVRLTGLEDGYVTAELVGYTLPLQQSVEDGFEAGGQALHEDEFDEAISQFAAILESLNRETDPNQWVDAMVRETVARGESAAVNEGVSEAISIIDASLERLEQAEDIPDELLRILSLELRAYCLLLEASQQLDRADETDIGVEQTAARQEAGTHAEEAVELLQEFGSTIDASHPRSTSHWVIDRQLKRVADRMLIPPSAVKEYLVELDTDV